MTESQTLLHKAMMALSFQLNGIGHVTDEQLATLRKASLMELLAANAAAQAENALVSASPGETKKIRIVTTDEAIASTYLRLHQPGFFPAEELVDACAAIDSLSPDTPNGHGILIDGYGNHSLIKLNYDGTGAIETIAQCDDLESFMEKVHSLVGELE